MSCGEARGLLCRRRLSSSVPRPGAFGYITVRSQDRRKPDRDRRDIAVGSDLPGPGFLALAQVVEHSVAGRFLHDSVGVVRDGRRATEGSRAGARHRDQKGRRRIARVAQHGRVRIGACCLRLGRRARRIDRPGRGLQSRPACGRPARRGRASQPDRATLPGARRRAAGGDLRRAEAAEQPLRERSDEPRGRGGRSRLRARRSLRGALRVRARELEERLRRDASLRGLRTRADRDAYRHRPRPCPDHDGGTLSAQDRADSCEPGDARIRDRHRRGGYVQRDTRHARLFGIHVARVRGPGRYADAREPARSAPFHERNDRQAEGRLAVDVFALAESID